jgi:hypothetical protein
MATKYYYSQASGDNDGSSEANAYTDLQTALNALSAGDHLYCKRHSSREGVKTTNLTLTTASTGTDGNTTVEGYTTTPGDGGMYQTSSPIDFSGDGITIKYMDVDADGDSDRAIYLRSDGGLAYRCKAVNSYAFGQGMEVQDASAVECYVKGKVTQANDFVTKCNRGSLFNCISVIASDSGAAGCAISVTVGSRANNVYGCLIINEDGAESHEGIRLTGNRGISTFLSNNTITNVDVGINYVESPHSAITSPFVFYGNIIYDVGTGIVNSHGSNTINTGVISVSNAFGLVTSAQTTNLGVVLDSVTLTESPFIDTTNFQLNNAPGGGALLKGKLSRGTRFDPSLLSTDPRIDFPTHGGIIPNPVGEVSRSF